MPRPTPIQDVIDRIHAVYNKANIASLSNEIAIDLDSYVQSQTDGNAEMELFLKHFKIAGNPIGDTSIGKIPLNCFFSLYDIASQTGKHLKKQYVTGLKIKYGLIIHPDGSKTLTGLYSPVCMDFKTPAPGKQENFNIVDSSKSFFFNGQSFQPIIIGVHDTYPKNFTDAVTICYPNPLSDCRNFKFGNDIESAIFTFQEIFTLIHDNAEAKRIRDENIDINFTRKIKGGAIQHSVSLCPSLIGIIGFEDAYANRAYLCPPDCKEVYIAL